MDVLTDTGFTCFVEMNDKMLLTTTDSKKTLMAYTNGRHQDSNKEGGFQDF